MMQCYARGTLAILLLAGLSSSVLAQWQEGDFSGELNWQGTVTHNRNPWSWAQGTLSALPDLNRTQAQPAGQRVVWNNLLTQTPLLLGKTERLMPSGRPGVVPLIHYGTQAEGDGLRWTVPGEARVTVAVKGKDPSQSSGGSLSFSMRVMTVMVSTAAGSRQGGAMVAAGDDAGNGLPPSGMALTSQTSLPGLQTLFGTQAPSWLVSAAGGGSEVAVSELASPQRQAVGAMYGAEIIAGSGELSFPADRIPEDWQVSLPVQISYR